MVDSKSCPKIYEITAVSHYKGQYMQMQGQQMLASKCSISHCKVKGYAKLLLAWEQNSCNGQFHFNVDGCLRVAGRDNFPAMD